MAVQSLRFSEDTVSTRALWWTLGLSLVAHGGALFFLNAQPRQTTRSDVLSVDIIEVPPPPPPPPPAPLEKPPDPPATKPPPVKVAMPRPVPDAPPPPNNPPPQEATPSVPLVVGISMESTVASSDFVVAAGNTLAGQTAKTAVEPAAIQAYAAPKYVPAGTADSEPQVDAEVKIPYPDEARRAGIEGAVLLRVTVDATGEVAEAKILRGPGYGLEEAALRAIRQFRFKPARKAGEAVGTTITYAYTFYLD